MGCEPEPLSGRPSSVSRRSIRPMQWPRPGGREGRLARMRCARGSVVAVLPASSPRDRRSRGVRPCGWWDWTSPLVFAEAVMLEDGVARRLGRIGMTRDHLAAFAQNPTHADHVVVEATGNASAADRRGAHQDRQDRRDRAGAALRQRLSAGGLDPGRDDARLATAGHPTDLRSCGSGRG
jgi:hypothetical protein